ncbi:PIEZ1 protein, partial [Polypterus senegalus]
MIDGKAEPITNTLSETMDILGMKTANLVGLGSDGKAVMTGKQKGVAKLLRDKTSGLLVNCHCVNRRLALAMDDAANTSRLLAPDLGVFFVSLIVLCLFNRLPQRKHIISEEHEPVETSPPQDLQEGDREDSNVFETNGNEAERRTPPTEPLSDNETEYDMLCREPSVSNRATLLAAQLRVTAFRFLKDISRFLVIALLGLAGITLPSAFSGVYFVLFIGVCTWWACCFPFSTLGFNALCVMVAFYAAGHLICLYLYQFSYVQDFFPTESIWARLFGFKEIVVRANCTSPDDLELNMDHEWPVYVNPGILLLLYFTMATVLKLQNPSSNVKEKNTSIQFPPVSQHNDNVEMELESWVAPQPSSKDESESSLYCVSEACGMQKHQSKDNPLQMFGRRIMQQSYISALIAMMVWSITYHSWLTFVLLLWACLIWIIRARRQFAMLCSPFILLYGLSLCTLQYIWAMDLGPELPDRVGFMSLKQLGLERSMHPCLRLGAMMYYSLWRRLLKVFWWLVVAYTMLVLIIIYTFQFEDFPMYWKNFTGFTEEQREPESEAELLQDEEEMDGHEDEQTKPGDNQSDDDFKPFIMAPKRSATASGAMPKCKRKMLTIAEKNHLLVLMLLVFEATVYRHQSHYYRQHQTSPAATEAVFPEASRENLDYGVLCCVKYFVNYCFYKFGLEQWKVFEDEKTQEWIQLAGENCDEPNPMRGRTVNPVPNFINCRCYLDMMKVVVFRHLFWFVLAVVFVTGSTRISVFGLGYLMACFYFLLFGNNLLLKSAKARLRLWDCLIMYNVAVIISKNMLSFDKLYLFYLYISAKELRDDNRDCILPVEEAGIIWDSICFFFLLLQRRVFHSYYFLHVTADQKASTRQASRGFELFKASIVKSMNFHQETERKSIAQLKRQMERIWAKQQKYKEGHHSSESKEEHPVLHSGEYYLFESDSEEEEDLLAEEQKPIRQSAFQLAYQAWITNAKSALKQRRQFKKEMRRQAKHKARQDSPHHSGKSDIVQRILDILKFLWVLFLAMVDGITQWLNTLTKQYVDTSTVLWIERYLLTHNINQVPCNEIPDDARSEKSESPTVESAIQGADTNEVDEDKGVNGQVDQSHPESSANAFELEELPPIDRETPVTMCYSTSTNSSEHPLDLESNTFPTHQRPRTASELLKDRDLPFEELEESARFYSSQNRGLKLLFALYNLLAANSELVCYFIIVLNNMVTASVISLVLPILIFLWAMLAIPRPSKRFWMIAIVYTEVMVVVKYLFQFGFFPWNSYYDTKINEGKPFFPPRILGLEKTDNYIRYDLMQLLVLFFHRSLLRRYGLWDQDEGMAEKKKMAVEKSEDTEESCLKKVVKKPDEEAEICEAAAAKPVEDVESDKKQEDIVEHTLEEPIGKGEKQENLLRFRKNKRSSDGKQITNNIYKPVIGFFNDILHTKYRAATDVYALMFLTDVVDFVIIVFGFWAFGKHSAAADIASTLSEDQVPEAFLVMLLIQFSTMVIDRALYLRKTVLGKLVFQVFLVFGIHFWMFFILPAVTERMFSQNPVAQLWYFVKCIYFALSAYQIRCGYPTRILGNFLTKKYNHLNLFLFQGFRLVPFLVELRAVMDWVWTDTTLSLSDWMCVEDIYANIFIIKCSRETEKKYPQPKGQKKKKIVKYGMGGLIIVFLICIIWFPLLFISLVRSVVGVVNHPVDVTVTVKLGGYEPLFTMSAQQQSIQPFTESNYDNLTKTFGTNPVAMQFITMYSYEDIVTANIEGSSGSVWRISPPSRLKMIEELRNSTADMTLRLMWTFQRDPGRGGTVENAFDKHSIDLKHNDPVRIQLASLLLGNDTNVVNVPHMFPNYIRAPNGADAKPVKQLYEDYEDSYLDVNLTLIKTQGSDSAGFQEWWDIHISDCDSSQEDCDVLPMVIFSDKISPPSLGFLAGYGIMGLYLSVVLVIGKFVRGFFSEISHSIMFEELPCVDRILKLCNDIFLVRETGELELEEELFSKLIFLYRSPETMIKWTREKD